MVWYLHKLLLLTFYYINYSSLMPTLLLLSYLPLGVFVAILQRHIMRKVKWSQRVIKQPGEVTHKNIGLPDRLLRLTIAIVVLVYGLWVGSELAVVIAGYTFYEALAKWCGLYALVGRNTCPIN